MRATFGNSSLIEFGQFHFMVTLRYIKSAHSSWYPSVQAPFDLPPMNVQEGAEGVTNYEGFLEFSMASQQMVANPRSVLGEHPQLDMLGDGGPISVEIGPWVSDTELKVIFLPVGEGTKHYRLVGVISEDGVERWRNPADN